MTCTLLTGGFGYIGSHTASVLAENNQKFIIVDNFINCKKDVVAKLEKITKQKVHFFEARYQRYRKLNKNN